MKATYPLITLLTFTPLAGAVAVVCLRGQARVRGAALATSLLALVLGLLLWAGYDGKQGGMQWIEEHAWVPSLRAKYLVGVDGLGLLMVLLSALVVPFALLASWKTEEQAPTFFALVLLLETGLFGTFTALNFFHWFIFWEVSLIPAYFLIKLWGGTGRVEAATQFFVYTMVGSITLLLGFLALYLGTGTFDFVELAEMVSAGPAGGVVWGLVGKVAWLDSQTLAMLIFGGIFLGFAIKVPLFPFHTWQPAAYAEAPTGVTMILSGALSKMGLYGFLRILLPIFPDQMRAVLGGLLWLALGSIIFSALAALAQRDLKRILAYASINHLGYCLLGIFAAVQWTEPGARWTTEKAAALNGVLLQMFNHGIIASAAFCFVGFLEERSGGQRGVEDFGGLRRAAPVYSGLMGIALFALLGLPGLSGFIGEFLIFKGAFPLAQGAVTLAVVGLLVTAVFLLTVVQRVFTGPLAAGAADFGDLSVKERLMVLPAVALMFVIGIYPQAILGWINQTVLQMVEQLNH